MIARGAFVRFSGTQAPGPGTYSVGCLAILLGNIVTFGASVTTLYLMAYSPGPGFCAFTTSSILAYDPNPNLGPSVTSPDILYDPAPGQLAIF